MIIISLHKIVEEASPMLDIYIHIPCKLLEPNIRLARQPLYQILSRVPFYPNTPQQAGTPYHNQDPN